jgi:hypothetical protein
MAIIVEDGTRVANANAYITVAYFNTWHGARGVDVSSLDTVEIEAAIVKATDYVDKRFANRFVGSRYTRDQSLAWPRISAWTIPDKDYIETDEIPQELKKAVVEYAYIALKLTDLLPTPAPDFNKVNLETGETEVSSGGMLQRDLSKVGPVMEDKWYSQDKWRLIRDNKAVGQQSDMISNVNIPEYPVADEWLKPILKTGTPMQLSRG